MRALCILLAVLLMSLSAFSQGTDVYLSRYLPGGPQVVDAEVSLFNATGTARDLSGYVLVSRYWQLILPSGIVMPPYSSVTFSSKEGDGLYQMTSFPGFHTFQADTSPTGDFISLFPRIGGELIDGLYFSEGEEVEFLPFRIQPEQGEVMDIPPETHVRWVQFRGLPDPVMAYDRNNTTWTANTRDGKLFPATKYLFVQARPTEQGTISIKWNTAFEIGCLYHLIERSEDGEVYREIGKWSGQTESRELRDYQFEDTQAKAGLKYFYRIRHVDRAGKSVVSPVVSLSPDGDSGFHFSVFKEGAENGQYLRIRYSALRATAVSLKLLDGQLRQIEELSSGKIEADREYLITYRRSLPTGVYYLMVETDAQRYHEVVVIR